MYDRSSKETISSSVSDSSSSQTGCAEQATQLNATIGHQEVGLGTGSASTYLAPSLSPEVEASVGDRGESKVDDAIVWPEPAQRGVLGLQQPRHSIRWRCRAIGTGPTYQLVEGLPEVCHQLLDVAADQQPAVA